MSESIEKFSERPLKQRVEHLLALADLAQDKCLYGISQEFRRWAFDEEAAEREKRTKEALEATGGKVRFVSGEEAWRDSEMLAAIPEGMNVKELRRAIDAWGVIKQWWKP